MMSYREWVELEDGLMEMEGIQWNSLVEGRKSEEGDDLMRDSGRVGTGDGGNGT